MLRDSAERRPYSHETKFAASGDFRVKLTNAAGGEVARISERFFTGFLPVSRSGRRNLLKMTISPRTLDMTLENI